jgi:hypothetical protein
VNALKKTEDEEAGWRISATGSAARRHRVAVDSPSLHLIAGEMEQRNLEN